MKKLIAIITLFTAFGSIGQTVNISTTLGGICVGVQKTYTATVSGYSDAGSCINYYWTISNNGSSSVISGTNQINITWNSGTTGTVAVLAEVPDIGGQTCAVMTATDTENFTISTPATGTLSVDRTPASGALCSGESILLTATTSGVADAGWLGWFNSSGTKVSTGTSKTFSANTAGTYTAKVNMNTGCGFEQLETSIAVLGPVTYTLGTAVGDRVVFNGKQTSGSMRVINSNAKIDRWEWKVGTASWATYETVSSHVLFYDEVFTEQTLFRAHIEKQCASEADQYLPTITIGVIEYVPDYNSVTSIGRDENGTIVSESAQYFDNTGRLLQTQTRDIASNEVFASEPLYDKHDRVVGQTLTAPINRSTLGFKEGFITAGGQPFDYNDFQDTSLPSTVDKATQGTVGWYYSDNNAAEGIAETKYPFAASNHYADGSGEGKSSSLPGDFHYLTSDKLSVSKTLPAFDGELKYYEEIRNLLVGLTNTPSDITKQVSIDANGNEVITFSDGVNVIATAIGNGSNMYNTSKYIETSQKIEFHQKSTTSTYNSTYTDLINDVNVNVNGTITPGIYSFTNSGSGFTFNNQLNYTDFSYNFYDNKGRMIASMTPRGTEEVLALSTFNITDKANLPFTNLYLYDFEGQLVEVTETDGGTSKFKYRTDGQIRFSQSEEQLNRGANVFSYTNYDELGRPIESGECTCAFNFESATAVSRAEDLNLQSDLGAGNTTTDWLKTTYDFATLPTLPSAFTGNYDLGQGFLLGAVSSTESEEVESWYSYDDYGRVTWYLQHLKILDKYFLIEYEYDFLGNVLKVGFQPQTYGNVVSEAFWHQYAYDQNQRLSKVETSVDDTDYYEHASYEYYKHGPLKRVVLAEDLQGIDYTYTPQGWLKAINHPIKGEDPGGDGSNNVSEDAFGMTLEYFEGDFSNANLNLGSLDLDDNAFPQQPNGNIRSVVFPGAENGEYQVNGQPDHVEVNQYDSKQVNLLGAESVTLKPGFNTAGGRLNVGIGSYDLNTANNVEAYAYTYDSKYQLTNAKFGKSSDMTNADNAYDVAIDSYDANGNIEGIERYADDPNSLENDFDFQYYPGTNKLKSVSGYINDMLYNEIGQLTKRILADGSEQYIAYDVSGKVTGVYSDASHTTALIEFLYDDRGFRIMKRVGDVENWYVRDASGQVMAIYNKQIPDTDIAQIELPIYGASKLGMAFKNPDHYKYIYELTDHLGNVRALVTKLALQATASMEVTEDARESQFFDNLDAPVRQHDVNRSKTGNYFALTNPGHPVGPTTTLRVKAGDVIDLEAFAKYVVPGGFNNGVLTGGTETLLGGGVNDAAVGVEGGGLSTAVAGELSSLMSAATANSGQPKAYLQFILFDDNFTKVDSDQVMTDSNFDPQHGNFEHLTLTANATVDGYLYAYVVNESTLDIDFDDFTFSQTGTRVIRQTDYYPFGAVAKVWNNQEQTQQEKYRHGYQGQYAEKDTTTGWNSFEARMYDPLIGRWMSMDPAGQFASPYNGMGNNPISGVDPDGRFSKIGAWWRSKLIPNATTFENPFTGEWHVAWSEWKGDGQGGYLMENRDIYQGGPGPATTIAFYSKTELAGRAGILNYADQGERSGGYKYDVGSIDFFNVEAGYDRTKGGWYKSDVTAGNVNFSAQVETGPGLEFDLEQKFNPQTNTWEGKSMLGVSIFRTGILSSTGERHRHVFGFAYDRSKSYSYAETGSVGVGAEFETFWGIELYQIKTK